METGPHTSEPARLDACPEVHLCDNMPNLLVACADIAGRAVGDAAVVLFIDDHVPLAESRRLRLANAAGATIIRVSDAGASEAFARLPAVLPPMLRRNVSWHGWRPVGPRGWAAPLLVDAQIEVGYVYNPGFFLSKVVAGRSRRVVMRDSGYANYVQRRVPWRRAGFRMIAGRSPVLQTLGEEPWVDEIQVVRPDRVPSKVRHKATRITLDGFMETLEPSTAREIALAFWDESVPIPVRRGPTALLVTQPIDQLDMCTTREKLELYDAIAERIRAHGLDLVIKPHPREVVAPLEGTAQLAREFPVEAWQWIGESPFELAVALNSSALADDDVTFARAMLQLVPPDRFYPQFWREWPSMIDDAFARAETRGLWRR